MANFERYLESPEKSEIKEKPLSPVLNSSRTIKKRIVKKSKRKEFKSEKGNNEAQKEIAGPSMLEVSTESRLKKLEEVEKRKNDLYKKLSCSVQIPCPLKDHEISNTTINKYLDHCKPPTIKLQNSQIVTTENDTTNLKTSVGNENFNGVFKKENKHSNSFSKLSSIQKIKAVSNFDIQNGSNVKNIFGNIDFSDLKTQNDPFGGFKKASTNMKPKSVTDETKETDSKRHPTNVDNIFGNEDFTDLNLGNKFGGFKKASVVNDINTISKNQINDKREDSTCRKNIFESEDFSDLNTNNYNYDKFGKALVNKSNEKLRTENSSKNCLKNVINIFENEDFSDLKMSNVGFSGFKQTATLNKINATSDKTKNFRLGNNNCKNIFENEDFSDLTMSNVRFSGFKQTATLNKMNVTSNKSTHLEIRNNNYKNIFENEDFSDVKISNVGSSGFKQRTVTVNKTNVTSDKNKNFGLRSDNCKNIFENEDFSDLELNQNGTRGFQGAKVISSIKSLTTMNYNEPVLLPTEVTDLKGFTKEEQQASIKICNIFQKQITQLYPIKLNLNFDNTLTVNQDNFLRKPKKRLGTHFRPSIHVSEPNMKRAKLMFNDINFTPDNASTPNKNEAPTRFGCNLTPIQSCTKIIPRMNSNVAGGSLKTTPCKDDTMIKFASNKNLDVITVNCSNSKCFKLVDPSNAPIDEVLKTLYMEKELLEKRLRIFDERITVAEEQKNSLLGSQSHVKVKPGILYGKKNQHLRQPLRSLVQNSTSEELPTDMEFLHHINPQNATLVHFCANSEDSFEQTSDGAKIIPNIEGQIGLSEIEHSFKVMGGVDFQLIPKGWIKNHYRWIVWKLSSYERMCPEKFQNCLSVENVIQQLKYRYDREIDRAERSALRKITEKDDCPQKRLVLCVSNIVKVNNGFELELSDGWYALRTQIDKPLSDQILKGKIQIGTKIVTCGAELYNCEGCSPLEVSDATYLKINYNSTRRAVWWAKLGYQQDSSPILVPMNSINLYGGNIGHIKFYIARVYPVKYLDKSCGKSGEWRNKKAEEKRANEWQYEKHCKLENLMNNKHETQNIKNNFSVTNNINIEDIDDGETLSEMIEMSNDPEGIQESLSKNQKKSLELYVIHKIQMENSRSLNRIQKESAQQFSREVVPLLKWKILGSVESDGFDFFIWTPNEVHLDLIKEGKFVSAFNVSCRPNWGFASNRNTRFRLESNVDSMKFEQFNRRFTAIEDLRLPNSRIFGEFDTVGIVIKKKMEQSQELWLASICGSLLKIIIYESPKHVLLLDGLEAGAVVIACNLKFNDSSGEHYCAVADHYTLVSKYSRNTALQQAADEINKQLVNKDIASFITNCKKKINDNVNGSLNVILDDGMESSQLTFTDIALLECVDKIV